ncbi:hypothetical protein DIZ76_010503 [Coccidioides immitis]|nr:hypothetical protein DIZ76_010503 [Coccidioides immitis]
MFIKGDTETHHGLEHQGVYIYKPARSSKANEPQQPKRRKLAHLSETTPRDDELPFVPLLDGKESSSLVKRRHDAFTDFWSVQSQRIQEILSELDSKAVKDLADFIKQAGPESYENRIPCGMITLGSNISSISGLLDRLRKRVQADGIAQVAVIEAGDAGSVKNVLKTLIRNILSDNSAEETDINSASCHLGPKHLPYDLELLHGYVQRNTGQKIVVAFKDSEAFDHGVLSDLISLLWSWQDRIPLVFLFGVATSVDLFESRLPRSSVSLLQGRCFDIRDSVDSIQRIFFDLETCPDGTLWLGHRVSNLLVEQSEDHFQSPERFSSSLKYTYMAHFFANPLAVLLSNGICDKDFQPELCEAIRNIPSFRRHAQTLLDKKETKTVKKLLDNDVFLAQEALNNVIIGQETMNRMFKCVGSLKRVLDVTRTAKTPSLSDLVIRAVGGELNSSKIIIEALSAIKKVTSNILVSLLITLGETLPLAGDLYDELQTLLSNKKGPGVLRTKYDDSRITHKTTLVAQRLKLTKGRAKLSDEEAEYTRIVDRFHSGFRTYLIENLIQPTSLFMHEAFLYDFKGPIGDTFVPRPRFTVERALSNPSDYLGFDSGTFFESLSASQPATALLYQLYLESGAVVNIYDLWKAFYTIISGEDGENFDERMALSIFYRAVSELKMMGMVKSSRRKTDHLAKLSWIGL